MSNNQIYYLFCNHWTQGGIGYAFPEGRYNGKKYEQTFSSVYTIHKMLDAADEYPGLKVSMELDSFCYEEVLKEDPECIERLKAYLKAGKAGVDGGTYGQPFGQDYGWESNIRHLTYGRRTVKEVLDYDVKAFLVEEQWFHPQLPQILLKSGYRYASLQNQNSGQVKPMNEAMIHWVGIDGSKLPAIPANDLMVSCVRQYTDYEVYEERLKTYERPLLFQWVEIWPPGMDWGASGKPFEKAILQVLRDWKGKAVTLAEYFELEAKGRQLKDVYISMDESNYVNNWYQDGGWGYDGDRIIIADKKAEQALLACETWAALASLKKNAAYPSSALEQTWKKFMTLQNHDYSVARGYRAYTPEGIKTNAGSLAVAEYNRILNDCHHYIEQVLQPLCLPGNAVTFFNPAGVPHRRTVEIELPSANGQICLKQGGRVLPFQLLSRESGKVKGLTTLDLPALGTAIVTYENADAAPGVEDRQINAGETMIEDRNIRVEWVPGTWSSKITDKKTGKQVTFTAFTGPIAKVNEHDGMFYPALSPAHEVFSFAFDGRTHSPDQVTQVKARVEQSGPVRSTLKLYGNVLTLHTTPTPVAFAEATVSIDHATGRVECQSHFYTGVMLSLKCWAEFSHNLPNAAYYRDFPFGEEKTEISLIYPNTYIRTVSDDQGFTLVHPGVQRAEICREENGGTIRHLIARDSVMGDYTWTFSLFFGKQDAWDSAALVQSEKADVTQAQGFGTVETFVRWSNPRIVLSSLYREKDATIVRWVNYSPEPVSDVRIEWDYPFSGAEITDFTGNVTEPCPVRTDGRRSVANLSFRPWEIVTLSLKV
jgi:Alpha-mannosidase